MRRNVQMQLLLLMALERPAPSLLTAYEAPRKYFERTGFSETDRTSANHLSHSSVFS